MKYIMVPTGNVNRFMDATKALEARLADDQIAGMGLAYGSPGGGKSMALRFYHNRCQQSKRVNTISVRALAHWSEASMMKYLLLAIGQVPRHYRKDVMFDQIEDALRPHPALILIDEIDAIAGNRAMISTLKDIHDVTGSAILMVGEERVDGLLRRYDSFYNRMNRGALAHLGHHSIGDVTAVVQQRCDYEVTDEVCAEIHSYTGGRSMRSVLDKIRDMEAFARTNGHERIGMAEYRKASNGQAPVAAGLRAGHVAGEGGHGGPPLPGTTAPTMASVAAAGGAHA